MKLRVARKVTYFADTRGRVYRAQTMRRAEQRLAVFEKLSRRRSKWLRELLERTSRLRRFELRMQCELKDLEERFR